jgi:hypothetical protein
MNCHHCAIEGETVPAIATCRHCGAGLCQDGLREALSYRVGGTVLGCGHDLTAVPPASTVALDAHERRVLRIAEAASERRAELTG